jgi:hypothetical protein
MPRTLYKIHTHTEHTHRCWLLWLLAGALRVPGGC